MAKYNARLTAPATNNHYYYSHDNIFCACGYGMPNCTCYAWGRLYELTGKRYTNLHGNAEEWWAAAEAAGLKTGQTPKLGAIICWRAGNAKSNSDGAGHVAVVEQIKSNGDIVISQSAYTRNKAEYSAKTFYTSTVTKASGYQYSSDRPLQGFIYCGIEYDNAPEPTEQVNIKAGAKLTLSKTPSYSNATTKTVAGYRNGTYYVWSAEVVNGRVRVTNKPERVGVKGQVTCWINVADIKGEPAKNKTFTLTKDCYTFWAVSRKFKCTVADIQALNPTLNPNNLRIGQVINVPSR